MANKNKGGDYNFLQKFSLFFFKRPSTTAIIWLVIAVFGIASYTTFLKREGFPSANTPFALGNGTYLVNNPAEVDQQIGKPVSSYLMKQDGVKSVQSQSFPNFYTIIVNYKEGIDSVTKSEKLNNEIKNAGMGTVDAAHEALAERFRPLIATSFTAVVSLIPLTLSSPFWEGLGVVLIFGLLSSTFLVVTVFPYYYLGAEFLRMHINRTTGIGWLLLSAILIGFFVKINASLVLLGPILAAILIWAVKKAFMRRANA